MAAKPKLLIYGSSFGKYGGDKATDYIPTGFVDPSKLNRNDSGDVETNPFDTIIHDYVKGMLGEPTIRVELTDFQLKIASDEAISKLHYHCPMFTHQYLTFEASAGISTYELPKYVIDNLEYVVYKKDILSVPLQGGTLEFDFFIKYFQENFLFANMNVGEFYLLQQYLETIRKILSNDGSWTVLDNKYLNLTPTPDITPELVIVEYKAINTETIHAAYLNWIQRYALAVSKGILGQVRGKFKTLPSPGGGAVLNGPELIQESNTEKQALLEELMSEIESPPLITVW